MNGLAKFCYILIGIGIGIIGTSIVYEHELEKPIDDDEFYIPDDEEDEDCEDESEFEEDDNKYTDISNVYRPSSIDSDSVKAMVDNPNLKTRYSKMYPEDGEKGIVRPLSQIEQEYMDYIQNVEEDDFPDDEPDDDEELDGLDDELTVELVEPGIAVYIEAIPNDYVELLWYDGDNTLCDDRDEIVPNPFEVVGNAALSRLIDRGPGAEDGVIYVRNLKTSINYEVAFCASSYSETVLGLFEKSRREGAKVDGGR